MLRVCAVFFKKAYIYENDKFSAIEKNRACIKLCKHNEIKNGDGNRRYLECTARFSSFLCLAQLLLHIGFCLILLIGRRNIFSGGLRRYLNLA